MGPRSDERGNAAQLIMQVCSDGASMGPRSDERGNRPNTIRPCVFPGLQWGRAPMSAEIRKAKAKIAKAAAASMGPRSDERGNDFDCVVEPQASPLLQWGRAPMSAEMPEAPSPSCRGPSCFNGAALR